WGGHLIEWNDCFETVLETGDHGSFNSWGRDRYWHSAGLSGPNAKDENGKPLLSYWIEKYPGSPYWDAYQTVILRNNRMQCDHGWDIDLDDGSSNFEIYNNLCLSGGLKTREGYKRIVINNIIIHESFDCRVPYPKPVADVFMHNILWGKSYRSSSSALWGGVRNANFAHNPDATSVEPAINLQGVSEDDGLSLYGNAKFVDPENGDFKVAENSPALRVGFENFETSGYGVVSERLKTMAKTPEIILPGKVEPNEARVLKTTPVLGAEGRSLQTRTDLSATGMFDLTGFILIKVPENSRMAGFGFKADDVVLEVDGTKIHDGNRFNRFMSQLKPGPHHAKIMRGQQEQNFSFVF
ncbi:MAG: PDZ domain-containing protein, partial [Bacteroidota bacterium]